MEHSPAISSRYAATAAGITLLLAGSCFGAGAEVFRDEFNSFSTTNWSLAGWSSPHGRTSWGPNPMTPAVSGGVATLKLNTYNPENPGVTFKGTEIISKTPYALETGKEFEARLRTNTTTSGIITAFFLYGAHGTNNAFSDEIDYEFATKDNAPAGDDYAYLNNWNEWSSGANPLDTTKKSSVKPRIPGLNVTEWNTYLIRWLPDRTEWWINGTLARSTTQAVPDDAMTLEFSIWAPDSSWQSAYSSALQPTADAASNVSHTFDLDYVVVRKIDNAWSNNAGGGWSVDANWTGPVPSGAGAAAHFLDIPPTATTVTVDSARTVGTLQFDSPRSYTVNGMATLTLDVASGSAKVNAVTGSHTISAPVQLVDATSADVAAGALLAVTGPLTGSVTLTKTGAGTLLLRDFRLNGLTVTGGTVQVPANGSAASKVGALSASTGLFDLTNNDLVIDYATTSVADTVRLRLNQARGISGAWTGTGGITSSAARGDVQKRTAIGYAEGSFVLGLAGADTGTWSGQTVDATSVLLRYTYYGDANLDGVVTGDDYLLLDRGFGRRLTGWVNGDFDYSGSIDSNDYALIDRAFALQSGALSPELLAAREAQFGGDYVSALVASVPEPSSLACMVVAAVPLLARRGRRNER